MYIDIFKPMVLWQMNLDMWYTYHIYGMHIIFTHFHISCLWLILQWSRALQYREGIHWWYPTRYWDIYSDLPICELGHHIVNVHDWLGILMCSPSQPRISEATPLCEVGLWLYPVLLYFFFQNPILLRYFRRRELTTLYHRYYKSSQIFYF